MSTNNAIDPAEVTLTATGIGTPPDTVTVKSAAGGSGTFTVARNQASAGTAGAALTAGVPLALDDAAAAEAAGPAVDIPVIANDVANAAAPITSLQLVGPAIPAGSGSAAINGTSITYTPGSVNGDVTFQYTASNSVGQSNVATVIVTVAPSAAGTVPIANRRWTGQCGRQPVGSDRRAGQRLRQRRYAESGIGIGIQRHRRHDNC